MEAPEVPKPEEPSPHSSRNPLMTATLAELYVSQGFLDRAIAIYLELIAADPENHPYRLRCTELKAVQEREKETAAIPKQALPPDASALRLEASPLRQEAPDREKAPAAPVGVDAELLLWLENIRRRRDGV